MDNIIELRPKQYQLIEIQTTLVLGNDKTYLNTVNIMFDNIIIEKIRVKDKHLLNNEKNINQITRRYFSDKLKPKKKTKSNKEKKKKAVSNLMDELNLF
tara:strand:+ start:476 stop:772 length:297 start_codon:yes stop_codon:yes gene_type:complete